MDEDQQPLFGEPKPAPDSNAELDEDVVDAPAAGPGQLTLDPTFDYRSSRRRGARPAGRPSLRALVGVLDSEQRMAGAAAIGMALSLFTPWWQRPGKLHVSNSGVSHFGFLELALLLICASVLLLLYRRAEARTFHLPLADGTLAAAAGVWCFVLIAVRMFDPPNAVVGTTDTAYDPRWGIFLALGFSILLTYAGVRGRRRYHAGQSEAVAADVDATPTEPLRARP